MYALCIASIHRSDCETKSSSDVIELSAQNPFTTPQKLITTRNTNAITMMKRQRRCSPTRMNVYTRVALCALCSSCIILSSAAFSPAGTRRRTVSIIGNPNGSHPAQGTRVPLLYLADSNNNSNEKSDSEKEKEFERAVRIAKAKKDIDMILSGPDAPFDVEGELKKVQGISPPLAAASKEQQLDDQVSELESELYAAVESQDYPLALQKKEEIGKLHMDDCGVSIFVCCES